MKKILGLIVLIAMCFSIAMPTLANDYHKFAKEDLKPQWPIKTDRVFYITGLDYYKTQGKHNGIDVGNKNNVAEDIYPIAKGTVIDSSNDSGYNSSMGYYVIIEHSVNGKKYYSRYLHFQKGSVPSYIKKGSPVELNTVIGKMGNTGKSGGMHLHFDITNTNNGTYDELTKLRGYTFDYYINNPIALSNVRLSSTWTNSSGSKNSAYWDWIIKNSKRVNGDYVLNTHIHNFKHDVANEKCYCGEKLIRQYQTINESYTVTTATSLKSKPYADYGERRIRLKKGDKVYVKRTFKNVYGNVWCEAESDGYNAYVYFGDLKGESNLKINLTSYPTSIKVGSSFGLRGTISSNYDIKKISGYIKQGNTVYQSTVDTPNSKSVDVQGANLNKKLLFNKLSAGNYSLYVEVVDASGKVVGVSKNFSVYAEQKKSEASTLKINLERYPVSIKIGSTFSVRGNITSNYSISRVRGYIYDADGNIVQSTTDTPNSTYMEIRPANLNQKLIFNKLSAGNYTMKVEAVDASGKVVTATKVFKVGGASNTPKPSETTSKPAPSNTPTSIRFELESVPKGNLPYGKSFSLKGWFRSDSAIVEARAYMLDSNKNVVMQSDKASSTTSNYKIQG
ncbi:MAG: M23 family metallopeptidase, partial [Clostridia bacterium]|nr:M23 family metallopeptidase [Clostridia bacterium]